MFIVFLFHRFFLLFYVLVFVVLFCCWFFFWRGGVFAYKEVVLWVLFVENKIAKNMNSSCFPVITI